MTRGHKYDVWHLTAETTIGGERRGFSIQTKARPTRDGLPTIPPIVHERGEAFLADVIDGSDVHTYDAVTEGDRYDYPYRHASYVLKRNGHEVARGHANRPLKPSVDA